MVSISNPLVIIKQNPIDCLAFFLLFFGSSRGRENILSESILRLKIFFVLFQEFIILSFFNCPLCMLYFFELLANSMPLHCWFYPSTQWFQLRSCLHRIESAFLLYSLLLSPCLLILRRTPISSLVIFCLFMFSIFHYIIYNCYSS